MGERQAIGIDVGGTKINAFRVTGAGEILERSRTPTPADDQEAALVAMIQMAAAVRSPDVVVVGVGAAGLVEVATGTLRFSPNIAWRDLPIAARMTGALDLPCSVDNDASVAAYGEFRLGAARGRRDVLMVTVGTGIGGGIVSGGRLLRGAHGFAAEVGHLIVEPGGPRCGCGNEGCWEQVAAGRAIGRLGREAALSDEGSRLRDLAGGDPERVTGELVTSAALDGEPVARRILAEVGRRLGQGIAGLVNILDPEIVVVGGGAISAGDLLLEPARAAFVDAVEGPAYRPDVPILPAELGNNAGAIGAAILALDELEA